MQHSLQVYVPAVTLFSKFQILGQCLKDVHSSVHVLYRNLGTERLGKKAKNCLCEILAYKAASVQSGWISMWLYELSLSCFL